MNDKNQTSEPNNPANWYGIFYYAPKDPNTFVPVPWAWEGSTTLNFARAESYLVMSAPLIMGAVIATCVALFAK